MGLFLIRGPAGAGKSQLVAAMIEAGEITVVADTTSLWASLSGAVRGPDGRYPVRLADDQALAVARYVQAVAVRQGLQEGADVAVTTSQRNQIERWRQLADDAGTAFAVRTLDPGESVVRARLADDTGALSAECETAIGRWYG